MSKKLARLVVFLVVLLWMGTSWWTRKEFFPYDVKNTDIGTYLFQAQTFADGHLDRPTPEPREFFRQWQVIVKDRSYNYYPPGHALLLAIPIKLGVDPWILPWLLSSAGIVLTYLWIRRLTGSYRAAWIGIFSLVASPFFAVNGASLLSHSSTLFFTLVFLLAIWNWAQKAHPYSAFIAGIALAWIFATRAPNAVALGLSWVIWLFWVYRNKRQNPHPTFHSYSYFRLWSYFTAGFSLIFIPLILYYRQLSGKWQTHLFTDYWPRNRYGFGKDLGRGEPGHYFQTYTDHHFDGLIQNWKISITGLAEWWTGLPALSLLLLALAVIFLIFYFKKKNTSEPLFKPYGSPLLSSTTIFPPEYIKTVLVPLIAWPLIHMFLYSLYFTQSKQDAGPRYLAELMPVFALATGWTFSKIQSHVIGRWFSWGLLCAMLFTSIQYQAHYFQQSAKRIPAVQQLEKTVSEAVPPALVLIRSFWIGHPFPFFLNRTNLQDGIIFACDRGTEDPQLIGKFPDRNAYILTLDFLSDSEAKSKLVQIYNASTRQWIVQPEEISSSFYIGSKFLRSVQLKGDISRTLFYPKPEEIPHQ